MDEEEEDITDDVGADKERSEDESDEKKESNRGVALAEFQRERP